MPQVIPVIQSQFKRGSGKEDDPIRELTHYHTPKGEFLAESPDGWPAQKLIQQFNARLVEKDERIAASSAAAVRLCQQKDAEIVKLERQLAELRKRKKGCGNK